MKKRVFSVVAMLTLLMSAFAIGASADPPPDRYQVGYAMKDVNPYIYSDSIGIGVKNLGSLATDPEWTVEAKIYNPATKRTTTERMIGVPLSGYANSHERPSGSIMDDNGDGFVGIGDGLHITCTTVTDTSGTTIVFFTVDAISGYEELLNSAAPRVMSELAKFGGSVKKANIFVNGSHTHEGADYGTVKTNGTSNRDRLWRAYFDYIIDCMVNAALECYKDRAEAIMTKGSIDASVSSGYQLNLIRQYKVEEFTGYGNGSYSIIPSNTYVFGSNFGNEVYPTQTSKLKRTVTPVSEADDTMHILQFTPTNGDQPIVLVNWRAHGTLMSAYTSYNTGAIISSDYIGSFRYAIQKAGYRMAFLQGAAGNVVAEHALSSINKNGVAKKGYTPWADDMPAGTNHAIYYGGTMLKNVALDCLKNKMTGELPAGAINSMQTKLHLEMQKDPEGLIAAAKQYQAEGRTEKNYKYKHTDGETYVINSQHHARNVVNRSKAANPSTYADIVLNAVTLGNCVAFVTSPSELFDRYSSEATLKNTTDNDWHDLVNENVYGTPFVMAYTNGHNGYTANYMSYNLRSIELGVGSYEANSSRNAAGEGEKILDEYDRMLTALVYGDQSAYCENCKKTVNWHPLLAKNLKSDYSLNSGHYYLCEDVPLPSKTNYGNISNSKVCLDLNGKTLNSNGRAFKIGANASLSIMDLAGNGCIVSSTYSNSASGGVIVTDYNANSEVNLYSGTLKHAGKNRYTTKGGIIAINAKTTLNIYGGVVDASDCTLVKDTGNYVSGNTDGCGAAIAVYPESTLNIFGGRILAGKAEPEQGRADCILVQDSSAKVTLSGNAQVDEIYFDVAIPNGFKVSDAFNGTVALQFNPSIEIYDGINIGTLVNDGSIDGAILTYADSAYCVATSETNLILTTSATATVGNTRYGNLQSALRAANGSLIRLHKDVSSDISVSQDAYIDLNGCSIAGKVTVGSGKTLYCMDSATDDYDVSDGKYGKVTNLEGMVAGIPEESDMAEDGYLKIIDNGEVSFHRVNLKVTSMTLRPENAGIYFKSSFACDEMVANLVKKFGVALSVKGVPTLEKLDSECKLSALEGFRPGGVNTDVTSTLLTGVMKQENSIADNSVHANIPIYGRGYILLTDGTYLFGPSVSRTFREQVEEIDSAWNDLSAAQKNAVLDMFKTYESIMKNWTIPSILSETA